MLRNYLVVALRTLSRRRAYALLNVAGLGLGLACCLLLARYVTHETSYDGFHADADRIYRLVSDLRVGGELQEVAANGWPPGHILRTEYPEVEALTYLRTWPTLPVRHDGRRYDEAMLYADDAFFDVFSFPIVEGVADGALDAPFEVVLSEPLRARLFGDAPAVGRTLVLGDSLLFTVTGVVRVPEASHIRFDVLASFATVCRLGGGAGDCEAFDDAWGNVNVYNYLRLGPGVDAESFAERIRAMPAARLGEEAGTFSMELDLEPLRAIYLHSTRGYPLGGPSGNATFVYLLAAVSLFILLLASINFVNLTTARSAQRAKEVGVRKAIGSTRRALVGQFLAESMVLALLALVVAVAIVSLALPLFNDLAGTAFVFADLTEPRFAGVALGLVVAVGGLAGLYPAFVLSRPHPAVVLKAGGGSAPGGARLRQALVVVQFAVSIALVAATLVVALQLRHMQRQQLGFSGEQVLVVDARRAPGGERIRRLDAFRDALAAHPSVTRVSAAAAFPGRPGWTGQHAFAGGRDEPLSLEYVAVDEHYAEALDLTLVAGRDLDAAHGTDAEAGVLINEAAARAVGWTPEEAVGRPFTSPGSGKPDGVVVGVVRDYHHHGLREAIGPMMFGVTRPALTYVALRLHAADAPAVQAHAEATWSAFFPDAPMASFFLDDDFAQQYEAETRLARVFGVFAGLAILIACLGLFGLAAFTAERRTKEIGVRKVLGASVPRLVGLLTREFVVLVTVAFAIAAPVAYVALDRWLDTFAYRAPLGPGAFVAAGAGALVVALLTVSYQAVRTAAADPVRTLQYE